MNDVLSACIASTTNAPTGRADRHPLHANDETNCDRLSRDCHLGHPSWPFSIPFNLTRVMMRTVLSLLVVFTVHTITPWASAQIAPDLTPLWRTIS